MKPKLSESRCQQGEWVVKVPVHVGGEVGERDAHRSEALAGLAARQARRCVHGVMQDAHHKHGHAVEAVENLVTAIGQGADRWRKSMLHRAQFG